MAAQAKIGQQLRFVDRGKVLDRFDFEYQARLNDDVHPIFQRQPLTLIDDRQANLTSKCQPSMSQLVAKTLLIGGFQQAGAKLAMNAVEVSVAAGGPGTAGGIGTAPAGPQPPCGNSTGAAATTPGANGAPVSATYASTGYAPGTGKGGSAGAS